MKLVIIGGGNMGSAIAHSLINTQTLSKSDLSIVELSARQRERLKSLGCLIYEEIGPEISSYDGILLAVKPQVSSSVFKAMSPHLHENQVIISIMAGLSIQQMVEELKHTAIVRVMPNTPAQIGEGVSVYFPTESVTSEQCEFTQTIFQSSGIAFAVQNEDAIDAATAISGSGPAYVFYLAEHMLKQAQTLGFSEDEATQLVQQTIKGAASLWQSQSLPVDELRKRVTSPGGTTEAALTTFEKNDVGLGIQKGMQAAYQRAKDLAR